ncbi:outer membrane homotrimeric porin [Pseudodesulfovibrio sp.]|nr:outer membrane homotrimeric porin [Pseudodesulfovibrio sp.]
MKRLIMLAVLCAFVLSAAAASAADIKASGSWAIEALWASNWDFKDKMVNSDADQGQFEVYQRATTTFEFVANENLKGVLVTRYGTQSWGSGGFRIGQGDSTTAANTNQITVRRAYVDFNYPDTSVNVKAGYLAVTLPNAFGGGSMILDEEVGAAVVSGAITDNVSYLLGYARAYSGGATTNQEVDGYVAALPMNFDGITFAPFGMYAPIGGEVTAAAVTTGTGAKMIGLAAANASDTGVTGSSYDNAYWLGAAFTMDMFDPFVLKADVNYGKVASSRAQNERSGWLFDAALEYKGMDFMTPEAFFVYTSGEDGNATKGDGGSERMPILAAQGWAMGSFFFGGDRLLMGSIGSRNNYMGFWALGLSLKDIQSFAEGMTHDAHFIYAKGTNDKNTYSTVTGEGNAGVTYGRTLTEDDSLFEVDFNTGYKLYDELTLSLDLGYVNLRTKKERWDNLDGQKGGDAWKISTGVLYSF